MIEAPPPTSLPSPTTTPWLMRPSTIEWPSVPALKFTKPSCMTVVPSARCAPRRTRRASAIRTPGGRDVVGHLRELVDRDDRQLAVQRAGAEAGGVEVGGVDRAAVGPGDVRQDAEDPVQVDGVGLGEPVAQQVQAQVGVVRVLRRVGEVLDDRQDRHDRDVAQLVRADRAGERAAAEIGRLGGPQRPRAARRRPLLGRAVEAELRPQVERVEDLRLIARRDRGETNGPRGPGDALRLLSHRPGR